MNYESKLAILKSYYPKKERLSFINHKLLNLKSVCYNEELHSDKIKDNSLLFLIEEKDRLEKELKDIEIAIGLIENDKSRYVLWYRFIENIPLNMISKSDILSYSYSQIYRYYLNGLHDIILK